MVQLKALREEVKEYREYLFQFLYGTIKRIIIQNILAWKNIVSIPVWYN